MSIDVLEVTPQSLAYLCLGGFVVLFSMISLLVKEKVKPNSLIYLTISSSLLAIHQ
ncbi:hypothetical protein EDD16DRAFT_1631629 [Pisolithus croceorrhizus]|nr:hypothetical protein EDD16DRAFT_1631629 [Pisolithus croceorrhizus]